MEKEGYTQLCRCDNGKLWWCGNLWASTNLPIISSSKYYDKNNSGLYHDHELILLCNVNGQKMECVRKNALYINTIFKHPPQVIKQLPRSINERLNKNSSSEEIFTASKYEYETALKNCVYQQAKLILTEKAETKS